MSVTTIALDTPTKTPNITSSIGFGLINDTKAKLLNAIQHHSLDEHKTLINRTGVTIVKCKHAPTTAVFLTPYTELTFPLFRRVLHVLTE